MHHQFIIAQAVATQSTLAFWFDLIEKLIVFLAGSGIAIPTIPPVVSWLQAHTTIKKHAAADAVKNRFIALLGQGVQAELATTVKDIKADYKAGNLTPDKYQAALEGVKKDVIDTAKQHATSQGILGDIEQVLGVSSLDSFAGQAVEALLAQAKLAPNAPPAAPLAPVGPSEVIQLRAELAKKTKDLDDISGIMGGRGHG